MKRTLSITLAAIMLAAALAGCAVEDETYHEGARIKKLTVAGRDISEYTIYCDGSAPMQNAAAEFSSLIARACGVTLAVSTAEPAAP